MFSAAELLAQLARHAPAQYSGLLIGLSGGGDSAALLAAAAELRDAGAIEKLRAVHVDHGLQSSAPEFRACCSRLCERFAIELSILQPRSAAASRACSCGAPGDTPAAPGGESIEAYARRLRYAAIAAELMPGECLLTAHHSEDQAETFLLQALRGAGLKGLAGMPVLKTFGPGWHLRPLLSVQRAELREYCERRRLPSCHDPMNADDRYDRVYLREQVWTHIGARWPSAALSLRSSAAHAAEAQALLEQQSDSDLARLRDGEALSLAGLRTLPHARRMAALRRWIGLAGARVPSDSRLREAARQFFEAGADRAPSLSWDDAALRRYRDRLYLKFGAAPRLDAPIDWPWHDQQQISLGAPFGRMALIEQRGGLRRQSLPGSVRIRARRGGERLRPGRGARCQSVQHLLQAHGIAPWMRSAIPLVFAGDELIAVADFWLSAEHCADHGQAGWGIAWEHQLALE